MTASHSSSVMFTSIRSRRIPALLTRMSSRPYCSSAWATRCSAAPKSETSSAFATASPPAAAISSTTDWAGVVSAPSPASEPPRSLTTTRAPASASASACSRPIPRPAPVTIATFPSSDGMREDRTTHGLRRQPGTERDLRLRRVSVADLAGGVGGARGGDARARAVRLHRGRRRLGVDDARQPGGVRAPAAPSPDADRKPRAGHLRRGARDALSGAVPARADRRALDRARGRRACGRPRSRFDRSADGPLERGVALDRGGRRGDGRRAALVPALLGQRSRRRGQRRPASRGGRLRRARRHARHADPRLAGP